MANADPSLGVIVPPTLSVPLVAALLGASPATGYRIAKHLPRVPIPGKWRVATADFERLFQTTVTPERLAEARRRLNDSSAPTAAPDPDTAPHPDTRSPSDEPEHV